MSFSRRPALPLHGDEAGAALLFWALSFPFFLMFLALAGDAGLAMVQRRDLQNAADAGALAGAQVLAASSTLAIADAEQWAAANVADLDRSDVKISGDGTRIQVTVEKASDSLFGGGLGLGSHQVTASATAAIASLAPGTGIVPVGIPAGDVPAIGEQAVLKHGPGGSNVGFIDVDGGDADALRAGLVSGTAQTLSPLVDTATGQNLGPTVPQALEMRLRAAYQFNPACLAAPVNNLMPVQCHPLASYVSVEDVERIPAGWPEFAHDINRDGAGDVQATPYILLPVVVESFTELEGLARDQHVQQNGTLRGLDGNLYPAYELALFFIDWKKTFGFDSPNDLAAGGRWQCATPDCTLHGQFVTSVGTILAEASIPVAAVEFDPSLSVHTVRLVD